MKTVWVTKRLGDVCDGKLSYGTSAPSMLFDGKTRYVRITDIDDDGRLSSDLVSPSSFESKHVLKSGDLVFARSGATVGKTYLYQDADGLCVYAGYLIRARLDQSLVDPRFVFLYSKSAEYKRYISESQQCAAQPNVNAEKYGNLTLPIPPLPEQRRIVEKVDAAFEKIDRLKANAEKNLANARGLFQSALNEAMRPKPGWVEKRLNEVFNFIDYRGKTPTKITSGIPLITAKNIRMGYLDYSCKDYISEEEFETRKSRGIAQKGDLLFTTEAPLGFVAMADKEVYSTGQRVITFQQYAKSSSGVLNRFYFYYLQAAGFQDEVKRLATGATAQGIKASRLKDIKVGLPPLDDQTKIARGLDVLSKSCAALQSNYGRLIADCAEMRQAVLKEAFEGRL